MMVDFGLPVGATEDLLELASDAIDLAKVAVGTAALYDEELLARKLRLFHDYQVIPFPGGQFLEYAIWLDRVDAYMREAARVGFDAVEVSDNLLEISRDRKYEIITAAVQEHGMRVLGEVGSKAESSGSSDLIEDALGCLKAGSWKVLVEAAEFFMDGEFDEALADDILEHVPAEKMLFELPGSWIRGVSASDIHEMQVWLLDRIGPDANVANVQPDDVLAFEALRRNLGVKMDFE